MTWLDQIVARIQSATPGPWVFATDKGPPQYVQLYSTLEEVDEYEADVLSADDGADLLISENNADLIAHAPEDIQALLEVARAAALFADHVATEDHGEVDGECFGCGQQWPCFVEQLWAALRPLTGTGPCTCVAGDGTHICPRESECLDEWHAQREAALRPLTEGDGQ